MVLTYHEAVEAVAGAVHYEHWRSAGRANLTLTPTACRRCRPLAAAALSAVGYADLLGENAVYRNDITEARRRRDIAEADVERLRAYIDTQPYLSDWDSLMAERDELRAERVLADMDARWSAMIGVMRSVVAAESKES